MPRLANGPSAGLLRVYDIVLELISHVDAQIDAESLTAFVAAYQNGVRLETGRALGHSDHAAAGLDRKSRSASRPAWPARGEDRDLANVWVERLQEMAETNPSHLVIVVADMAQADLPLSSSFVAEFCQRLSR